MPSWRATSSWGSQRRVPPPGMALGNSQDEGRAAVKSVRPKFMFSGTSECNLIRRQRPCGCTRQGQTRSWWGRVGPSSSGLKALLRRRGGAVCSGEMPGGERLTRGAREGAPAPGHRELGGGAAPPAPASRPLACEWRASLPVAPRQPGGVDAAGPAGSKGPRGRSSGWRRGP